MVGTKESGNKKYILHSILLLLFVVGFIIFYFFRTLIEAGVNMEAECKVIPISFQKNRVTLYIVMRDYGLNLQYCHTIISKNNICSDNVAIDRKKDIIRESVDRIYYKVKQPDSLFILEPSWNHKIDASEKVGGINIMIEGMKGDSLNIYAPRLGYQLLELDSKQ